MKILWISYSIAYAETSISLGFHWNYVFYKRLQFNVLDFIACNNSRDKNANTITYRQVSDVGKLRANVFISLFIFIVLAKYPGNNKTSKGNIGFVNYYSKED